MQEAGKPGHKEAPKNVAPIRRPKEVIVVMVTCPSKQEAEKIARALVQKRLAACASVVAAGLKSIYTWGGKIETARETLLMLKTTRVRFAGLEKEVRRMHSYEVPEIISMPVTLGSADYLKWVVESTRKD
jgi:periplasmic divalent cation tolerance protein